MFNVGDRVKVLDQSIYSNKDMIFLDMTGELVSLYNNEPRCIVRFKTRGGLIDELFYTNELMFMESNNMEKISKEQTVMRTFGSGATRHTDVDKLDYEGFLSPLVIERYAQYLHKHRTQADGKLRDSDNWQKGIPRDTYMKSAWRHLMAWWRKHRGHETQEKIEDDICAVMFNTMGYLHELLKDERLLVSPTNDDDLDGTGRFHVTREPGNYRDFWYISRNDSRGKGYSSKYLHTNCIWRPSTLPSCNEEWTTQAYVPSRVEALNLYKLAGGKIT